MTRISKQDRRKGISRRKIKYNHLNPKTGSCKSFPIVGYKMKENAAQPSEHLMFISKSELSIQKHKR